MCLILCSACKFGGASAVITIFYDWVHALCSIPNEQGIWLTPSRQVQMHVLHGTHGEKGGQVVHLQLRVSHWMHVPRTPCEGRRRVQG